MATEHFPQANIAEYLTQTTGLSKEDLDAILASETPTLGDAFVIVGRGLRRGGELAQSSFKSVREFAERQIGSRRIELPSHEAVPGSRVEAAGYSLVPVFVRYPQRVVNTRP